MKERLTSVITSLTPGEKSLITIGAFMVLVSVFLFPLYITGILGLFFVVYTSYKLYLYGGVASSMWAIFSISLGSYLTYGSILTMAVLSCSLTYIIVGFGIGRPLYIIRRQKEKLKEEREFSEKILNVQGALVIVMDTSGRIVYFNKACEEVTGFGFEDVKDTPIWEVLITDEEKEDVKGVFNELLASNFPNYYDNYLKTKNNDKKLISWRNTIITGESDEIKYVVGTGIDVTEQRKLQDKIKKERDYLYKLFNNMKEYVFVIGSDFTIEFMNRSSREEFGDHLGEYCYEFLGYEKLCDDCKTKDIFDDKINHPGPLNYERKTNGKTLDMNVTRLENLDDSISALMVANDITERKKLEDKLRYLSMHDSLTGLYNRDYFEKELKRLEKKNSYPIAIISCDLDGLKIVNDTMGHDKGDELLQIAAKVIQNATREKDITARIGGDEFAIILPSTDEKEGEEVIKKIRELSEDYSKRYSELPLSISLGLSTAEDGTSSLEETLKKADEHMYRDKLDKSKSARVQVIDTLMSALAERDHVTEGHVKRLSLLCTKIGERIGLSSRRLGDLSLLAQVHDIGKVGTPDNILFKKGPLSDEEWKIMKQHSEKGHRIALSSPDLSGIADLILKHHERWDGRGYPLGTKGKDIPAECRILAIVDAYDAMTSDRPYRKALSKEEAIKELRNCAGTQFDPELVEIFCEVIESEEYLIDEGIGDKSCKDDNSEEIG
ncbi:diguanylate cyclase domain-containing protein [Natranaerofaba carboxydovora]|uniref:diguanylate cyclase domain-containing protein n=1 Tax=Natranaerofaba carboxydovora TaxID=2742683 RepID=UPI001F12B6B8|nr:diguanylate cyclase [Natranaerofaba carboxydovora]UMZ74750.1 3'3'-cGAMP-specific phosphodiesterase 2 [Natranaerofaba carboxydovora]